MFATVLSSYLFFSFQKKVLGKNWGLEKAPEIHRLNARRIEATILELKGLFIKVGQMLSIMSNFLPEAFTQGLERLQDSVPPHPYSAIENRFREEFSKTPQEMFSRFSETPIASASLGQVHVAYLQDGTKVAVKVQYPEIGEIVRADLKIMSRIFGILHIIFPHYGLKHVYREIADVAVHELDYTFEGKNLETLKKNFEGEKDFLFPDVYWDLSSQRILTLRFMEGVKISATAELKKMGVDPTDVATKIIHGYCKQIFVDGIYHADPHPGNILIQNTPEGAKIVLVDFGATATISEKMRRGITLFAEGLIKKDTRVLANAVREMGFVARQDSFEPFEQMVDYFYEKLSNIKIENFRKLDISQFQNIEDILEMRKVKISFRDLMTSFYVPKDWLLLERTLLLTMGLCAHLDPKLNPVEIVLPYVETFVLKDKTFTEFVLSLIKEVVVSYLQLPHEIHKTLRKANEGSLGFKVLNLPTHTRQMYVLGHQFLYSFLGAAGLLLSSYFQGQGNSTYADYSLYGAGFFGVAVLISIIKNRLS